MDEGTEIGRRVGQCLRLKERMDAACWLATHHRKTFQNAAVNWADFGCVQVDYCINDIGQERFQATVEEGSPDNSEVVSYLREKVPEHEGLPVEIQMEW